MNRIVDKEYFSEKVVKLVVEAPMIAKARKPGHFVIVIADERGERIPLTIADADVESGTITLVVQAVGDSTRKICSMVPGDSLADVVGPLGRATPCGQGRHCGVLWRRSRRGAAVAYNQGHEAGRQQGYNGACRAFARADNTRGSGSPLQR